MASRFNDQVLGQSFAIKVQEMHLTLLLLARMSMAMRQSLVIRAVFVAQKAHIFHQSISFVSQEEKGFQGQVIQLAATL